MMRCDSRAHTRVPVPLCLCTPRGWLGSALTACVLARAQPEGEQGCFARLEVACSLCGAEPAEGSGQKWKACGACGITQYCSADCQREAWKRPVGHKSSCGAPLPTPGAVAAASPEALAALLAQWCRADVEL